MPLPRFNRVHPIVAALTAALIGATVSGCATTSRHTVKVSAAVNPDARSGYSYTLAPDAPGQARNDAFHTEVTQRIHTALTQRGLYAATRPADADIVVSFDYGAHPPQVQVKTVTEPVFASSDPMSGPGIRSSRTGGLSPRGYPPVGPQPVMTETIRVTQTAEKYLRIDARENNPKQARVWSVEATVEDEVLDVAQVIPAMVDAVIEYIGHSTTKPEEIVITLGPDGPTR